MRSEFMIEAKFLPVYTVMGSNQPFQIRRFEATNVIGEHDCDYIVMPYNTQLQCAVNCRGYHSYSVPNEEFKLFIVMASQSIPVLSRFFREAQRCRQPLQNCLLFFVLSGLLTCQSVSVSEIDSSLVESIRWYTGETGTVDDARAKVLLEEAVARGDAISLMWLARVYSTGRMGFPADKTQAKQIAAGVIAEIERRANAGSAEAAFLMGTAYAENLARPLDPVQAVQWYRLAAAQQHVLAQHNLGNVYFSGTGVPQDDAMAVQWWTLAAEQGDAIPQYRLGIMFEEGRGVSTDLQQALRWYRDSAQRGNANARAALLRLNTQ